MGVKGMQDSRASAVPPRPGKVEKVHKANSASPNPGESESFGDKRGGKKMNWKGNKDNR